MMRSLFAAISGLSVHQTMLDVTANDIANVNTVGFKGDRISFKDALSQLVKGGSGDAGATATLGGTNPAQIGLGVQVGAITSQMSSGAIQSTGNPLDVAIQGNGWFRVATGDGTATGVSVPPMYTRAGNFTTDASGALVTEDGMFVVGRAVGGTTDEKIVIPAGAKSISIDQSGVVSYVDGTTGATTQLAQISLAKFANDAGLERVSATKFQASAASGVETAGVVGDTNGFGTLAPGSLEMSNVDLAQEFTNMITAERGFQANSRVISTADQILQDLVNLGR